MEILMLRKKQHGYANGPYAIAAQSKPNSASFPVQPPTNAIFTPSPFRRNYKSPQNITPVFRVPIRRTKPASKSGCINFSAPCFVMPSASQIPRRGTPSHRLN
jgi:hypothetical protein